MKKRDFLKRLLTGGAAVAAASTLKGVAPAEAMPGTGLARATPIVPTENGVTWPCLGCQAETTTPKAIWDATKLRLSCTACGRRQPYLWHLKKFDPTPTEYVGGPGHPLATIHDVRPAFLGPTYVEVSADSIVREADRIRAMPVLTPRERQMAFFRERRARKRARRGRS